LPQPAEVRECHHTVVAVPVDPDDAVFGVHLVGDIMEPVHALAEFSGDTINRFDERIIPALPPDRPTNNSTDIAWLTALDTISARMTSA
jgi:hypothetical protein